MGRYQCHGLRGTINFGSALTASINHVFYTRIAAGLNKNAKTFTDTVTMRLRYDNGPGNVDRLPDLPVTINNQSVCLLSTPPGNIVFNYTSFQAGPATASAAYAVRCTVGETYTMALDAAAGTLLNLTYSLALSNPAGQTGTGFPQNFTINGTIAGGQSGTCATGVCIRPAIANPDHHILTQTPVVSPQACISSQASFFPAFRQPAPGQARYGAPFVTSSRPLG
jgi:spore coat protein U-like protein